MKIDRQLLNASWHSWISPDHRPRAGAWWLPWIWTVLFSAALALPFTLMSFIATAHKPGVWDGFAQWAHWYGKNLIVCLTISATIHLLFDGARLLFASPQRVRAWQPWQRAVFFSGLSMFGVALGWPVGMTLAGVDVAAWFGSRQGRHVITSSLLISLLVSFLFYRYYAVKARQLNAERRAAEAQLRLLQGQIEPHFLFNTLANVHSLMDHDPPKAKQMLSDFTEYLRSSLTTLRNDANPLAQELDLAEHYLRLLGSRMEDRLQWRIDADAAARAVPVPPLLLQPLVENAIVHGLEPQLQGGAVHLSARVVGGELVLEVRDDGRGPDAPPRPGARAGQGMALANIRGRLLSHYGHAASLELSAAHPGTRAVIRLPIEPPPRVTTCTDPR